MDLSGYLPPTAARYLAKDVIGYLSPEALHADILNVLRTYAEALFECGEMPESVYREIESKITRDYVPFKSAEEWENKLRHDIRGVVRACQGELSNQAKSFIYLGLTSYDPVNTGQSCGLRDFGYEIMTPKGIELSENLIEKARKYKDTPMIGRTHKQHATATTAGHWFTEILGGIVPPLKRYNASIGELKGKVSGFVGNNAAKTMLFNTPAEKINRKFFEKIGLKETDPTGQTVHQHWYTDYFSQLIQMCGGIWKFAEDLRNYQQTEVAEMAEQTLSGQVGSSTGAHKKNPIKSEQTGGGLWRQMMGQYMASLNDLQTDFQRDLRDSSNKRGYIYQMGNLGYKMADNAAKISKKMTVRPEKMAENIAITKGLIAAEPLQNYLQLWCGLSNRDYFDAHEYIRKISDKCVENDLVFIDEIQKDPTIRRALDEATFKQREMILEPEKYIGSAVRDVELYTEKAEEVLASLKTSA